MPRHDPTSPRHALVLAAALLLTVCAPARADYAVMLGSQYDPGAGWGWTTISNNIDYCGLGAVSCSGPDFLSPAAMNVPPGVPIASGGIAIASIAAPHGTTIVGGWLQLRTSRTDDAAVTIHVNAATGSTSVKNGTTVYDVPAGNTNTPVTLPAGSFSKVGIVMQTTQALAGVPDASWDHVAIDGAFIQLRDSSPPGIAVTGSVPGLGDGQWRSGTLCLPSLVASDTGSGVTAFEVLVDGWMPTTIPVAGGTALVPGQASVAASPCLDLGTLSDGSHSVTAWASNGSGGTTTRSVGTILVDNSAPAVSVQTVGTGTPGEPLFLVRLDEPDSPVTSIDARIDGVPVAAAVVPGGYQLAAPAGLSPGIHDLAVQATNQAGLTGVYSGAFPVDASSTPPPPSPGTPSSPPPAGGSVGSGSPPSTGAPAAPARDRTGPTVDAPSPAQGATAPESGARIAFHVADSGSGLAAGTVRVSLDGSKIYPGSGTFAGGTFAAAVPGPLAWGTHVVTVRAADAAGNVKESSWSFAVAPSLHPSLPRARLGALRRATGVSLTATPGGAAIALDAAADEYEDARLSLHGVHGTLAATMDPDASDGVLIDGTTVLRVETTKVRGRTVQDPLPPLAGDASANGRADLLVRVNVPAGTPAGVYHGVLRVTADGSLVAAVPVSLHVYGVQLPARDDPDAFRTLFLVAPQTYINAVDDRTGDDPHESGAAIASSLMRFLSAYRVNPGDWGYASPGAEGYVDGSGWWRETRSLMLDAGQYPFSAMRLPITTQRAVASHPGPSPRDPKSWPAWLRSAVEPLWQKQGWLARSVAWGWDEPGDVSDRGVVSQQACAIHQASPTTDYLLTDTLRAPRPRRVVHVRWGRSVRSFVLPAEGGDNRQLWDGKGCDDVDTWVLLSRRYYGTFGTPLERAAGLDPAHSEQRLAQIAQRRGATLWSYTYTAVPGSPGYAADEPVTDPTVFMLWNALEGLDGTLYADGMMTYKGRDPYTALPGDGQGVLVYPASASYAEPVSSLRLEAIRDGVEDADLARLLAKRRGQGAVRAILARERIFSIHGGRVQLACTMGCDLPGSTKYAFPRYRRDGGTAAALRRVHRDLLQALSTAGQASRGG